MARHRSIDTPDSNQPRWEFSQAVLVEAGTRLLFTSQIIGMEADGTVARDDLGRQAEQAYANLAAIVAAAGGTMADVVKLTVYLTDDFGPNRDVLKAPRARHFRSDYPASVLVRVPNVANPDARIALEAVVSLP